MRTNRIIFKIGVIPRWKSRLSNVIQVENFCFERCRSRQSIGSLFLPTTHPGSDSGTFLHSKTVGNTVSTLPTRSHSAQSSFPARIEKTSRCPSCRTNKNLQPVVLIRVSHLLSHS